MQPAVTVIHAISKRRRVICIRARAVVAWLMQFARALTYLAAFSLSRLIVFGLWALYWGSALPAGAVWLMIVLDLGVLAVTAPRLWWTRATFTPLWSLVLRSICAMYCVLALLGVFNSLARAYRSPPPPATAPTPLPVADGVLHLKGPLDFDSFNAVQAALDATHEIHAITLSSNGGRIPAARGVARLIRENGLSTHVDDTCASACTLAFIAGHRRTIAPEARIGFHGYRLLSMIDTIDAAQEQARDAAGFIAQGVCADFVARAFDVPHDDMWFPAHGLLRAAGVVTATGPMTKGRANGTPFVNPFCAD